MSTLNKKVALSSLSNEAHYAFNYALALIGGRHSIAHGVFVRANSQLKLTEADKKKALQSGLNELMAQGLLECERDGHQEWVPRKLRLDRVIDDTRRLVH